MRSNKRFIIFAPKTNMLWEDVIHISGIANPHIQSQRIANPLGRGLQIPIFKTRELQIRWDGDIISYSYTGRSIGGNIDRLFDDKSYTLWNGIY